MLTKLAAVGIPHDDPHRTNCQRAASISARFRSVSGVTISLCLGVTILLKRRTLSRPRKVRPTCATVLVKRSSYVMTPHKPSP